MPGGMSGILGGGDVGAGALGGALDIPDLGGNPMAAPDGTATPDLPAAGPLSPF